MLAMHGLQLGISQASAYPAAMSFDTDAWLERRKLSRRLNWWRFIAVVALLAAGLGGLWWLDPGNVIGRREDRSEEHTSELQSLMRISYAVFCLKKKNQTIDNTTQDTTIDKNCALIKKKN